MKGGGRYFQTANVASMANVECKSKHNQELVVLLNVLFIDRPVYLTNKLIPLKKNAEFYVHMLNSFAHFSTSLMQIR